MTRIDEAAALDAIARLDDGVEQPGDRELADRYDRVLQDVQDLRVAEQIAQAERDYRQWWQATFGGDGDDE